MKINKYFFLILIFSVALLLRLYQFGVNDYFGFDEARDAYISQAIYTQGDFKITGPAANGVTGLNHGVLHWYLIGALYLAGFGSPLFVAGIFRLLNALAIFPIFFLTNKLFGRRTAYLTSIFFAFSFEASQYALYYGNPSLAVWSWIAVFGGAVIIYKDKNKFWGLPLMAIGVASGAQLELPLITLLPLSIFILTILKKELGKVSLKSWALAFVCGTAIISPYILSEIKNGFRSFSIVWQVATNGYQGSNESRWVLYGQRWLLMLHDNFWPVSTSILTLFAVALICFWITQARRKVEYRLLLIWIFGGLLIFALGTYNAYYINVGIGTGVIVGISTFLDRLWERNKALTIIFIFGALLGNWSQIKTRNLDGLSEDIKTQQFMFLSDEVKVINEMYSGADHKTFTVRVTSMPYKIQTVWAYLFHQYGSKRYGYLPYYETGNALGYPGYLPAPNNGSTCVRFLLREPYGGIPQSLINGDIEEENFFSKVVESKEIGHFHLEKRLSKAKDCLTKNFP